MYQITPLLRPFNSTVFIPGCLSYTTRSLILAAMTKGEVKISNPLKSDDVYSMLECLREIGILIQEFEDYFLVKNSLQELDFSNISTKDFEGKKVNFICNGGLSGRTARSILPLLCLVPGSKILTADKEFLKRPIAGQVEGLRQIGAEIEYLKEEGKLPVLIKSSNLKSGKCQIPGNVSSQYFAGIMMIAPLFGGVELEVVGSQVSKSYIDITIDIMKTFGVEVENQNYQKYIVKSDLEYKIEEYKVEGDYSSSSYFAAMAALTESRIELKNLNQNSKQGDKLVLEILAKMGAVVEFKPNSIIVQGRELKPVKVDMENAIDQPPVVAVLAAFIDGVTEIDGVGILKYKESDRLLAIQNELLKMGIKTKTSQDKNSLKIFGGSPKGAEIETYGDHRIAMAFAISGLKISNIKIKNPEVVKKSFPNFWEVFESLRN